MIGTVARAFFRRDLQEALSYRAAFALQLVTPVTARRLGFGRGRIAKAEYRKEALEVIAKNGKRAGERGREVVGKAQRMANNECMDKLFRKMVPHRYR